MANVRHYSPKLSLQSSSEKWKQDDANVRRVGVGAYEIVEGEGVLEEKRAEVPKTSKGTPGLGFSPFFSMIFFLWLLSAFRRR